MGWFIWLAFPATTDLSVTATTMTGGLECALGPLLLILHVLTAGVPNPVNQVHRIMGRPISRAFGSFGSQPFSQALGWALIPISLWCLVNGVFYASDIGF